MTRSIIRVFKEKSITESKWMSEESKNVALQKIEFLKYFIGFPTWLKHASKVNSAYSDVSILICSTSHTRRGLLYDILALKIVHKHRDRVGEQSSRPQ